MEEYPEYLLHSTSTTTIDPDSKIWSLGSLQDTWVISLIETALDDAELRWSAGEEQEQGSVDTSV